jgi:crotonobetainyl-CoA:carnitine CoA-transferase CaiB-like acyl-CoA transferase
MAEPNWAEIVTAVGVETRRHLSQFKTPEELRTACQALIASNSVGAYIRCRARTTTEASTLLLTADVGVHAVTSLVAVMAPGGTADDRGLRIEERSLHLGAIVMPGPVLRFGRTPMRPGALAGPFGSDRDAVLRRLGPEPS